MQLDKGPPSMLRPWQARSPQRTWPTPGAAVAPSMLHTGVSTVALTMYCCTQDGGKPGRNDGHHEALQSRHLG
eukprot:3191529-Amphidinium_carterae.1